MDVDLPPASGSWISSDNQPMNMIDEPTASVVGGTHFIYKHNLSRRKQKVMEWL